MNEATQNVTMDSFDTVKVNYGYLFIKRLFDIVVSMIGIIFLLPITLVVKIMNVANKDFGARNGREHYHAAVLLKGKIDYSKWKYGCLNGQKIRLNGMSDVRLAKYIAKLTNHAIKETCKRNVLIYSR